MKRVYLLIGVLLFVGALSSKAQSDYQFEYQEKELTEVTSPFVKKHFLGEQIAVQLQLLRETYTYKDDGVISNTETTVVEKPSIYHSVAKVNKYLKKEVKKGILSTDEAEETLSQVLKVTLNIRYQDTEKLEEELWSLKNPQEITKLYTSRIDLGI